MNRFLLHILIALLLLTPSAFSFAEDVVDYSSPSRQFTIADIQVHGATAYDDNIIIGFSGLSVGQKISIPGDEITSAIKKFWKQGMFDDVKIVASKFEGDNVFLDIILRQRPKITDISFRGCKKSEREDLETQIALTRGGQYTTNFEDQTRTVVFGYFKEKGFRNVAVRISTHADNTDRNAVSVVITVSKGKKVKVKNIYFTGNNQVSRRRLNKAMKKTNETGKLKNIFRTKKFVQDLYETDKQNIIDCYNERGFRDAVIVADSVRPTPNKPDRVDVFITLSEGDKYYIRSINWIGNTLYSTDELNTWLRISPGDTYNAKLLQDRLVNDEDAVSNLYQDNGYLFSNIEPVEINVESDSIDYEMRVYEGRQATINRVGINGNDRVYEHVVRRELRTKPGQLYSKSDIMRTMREVAQMGFFDPEKIVPDIQPDPENGTVDINYNLESKSSDQVEASLGYGATGLTGSLGLKFTNFAIQNIFKPSTYRIVPQGEGQTLSFRATTNGSYYTSFSGAFVDNWFRGKRPNQLSLSAFYSRQSGVSSRSNVYASNYYSSLYSSSSYGSYYAYDIDPDKYIHIFGVSLGLGKRLSWPDDYFTLTTSVNYTRYNLKNWTYFIMTDGSANNFNFDVTLGRSSIDNPIYTRSGSTFSIGCEFTPPYSLWDHRDFSVMKDEQRYKWLEYHKWKLKSKLFMPLTNDQKLVLMFRADYGYLGYFNSDRKSPFGTFYVGGDGMSGSYSTYSTEVIGLRGYSSGSLTPYTSTGGYNGNVYTRLSMELRYPLVLSGSTTIFVLGFAEGGNCWDAFEKFNPFSLKRSAGVGVRLYLPMFGLMGVDWGYGFDTVKDTPSYSGSHFSFVIGQEF